MWALISCDIRERLRNVIAPVNDIVFSALYGGLLLPSFYGTPRIRREKILEKAGDPRGLILEMRESNFISSFEFESYQVDKISFN